MGHHINAVIGTHEAVKSLAAKFGPPIPTELPSGLVIVPLDELRLDMIAMSVEPAIEGFTYLTPLMAQEIASTAGGSLLYIETHYFGGTGGQSAAYFQDGGLRWWRAESSEEVQPGSRLADHYARTAICGKSPISEGLSKLGVQRSDDCDEFDQIGLHRFRSLEALGIEFDD